MRILAALLLIGLASAAEAQQGKADLGKIVMTQGKIMGYVYDTKKRETEYHLIYKNDFYVCRVSYPAFVDCNKAIFFSK